MKTILSFLSREAHLSPRSGIYRPSGLLSPAGHFIARSAFILLLCCPMVLAAQHGSGIAVAVSTGSPTTVMFDVSWSKTGMPDVWSDTVWVWVDYNNAGKMERLPVTGATLTATSAPGAFTCIPSKVYELEASASTFCEGGAGVTFALSGTDKGASYELYRDDTPEAVATLEGTGSPATFSGSFGAGTYSARTVPDGGFCPAEMSGMHEVSEQPVPTITTQPAGNSVCSNGTVQLRVVATGATAYQWRKNGVAILSEGSGYTSATYTTAALSANATYTVVVSNAGCSVTSSAAPVTLITLVTDFTKFTPFSSEPIGTTWCLVDKRAGGNSYTYKVRKMPDGHIWMVQDLKFGTCPNDLTHWNNDNSEAATASTPTVHDGYVGHCRSTTYTDAGFLYNWPAAMQSTKAYYGSTVTVGCSGTVTGTSGTAPSVCQGICPEGWHIPTGKSTGEFYDLHYNYNRGCVTTNGDCWNAFSDWEGVLGGYCSFNGTPANQGSLAAYWSSTYASSYYAYGLYFINGATYPGTHSYYNKDAGFSVRCLRNY
jgi:uncharacterized protein (TIGR02145 family)